MTITSTTNALAFAIGAITTDVPFVRDFCALTGCVLWLTYVINTFTALAVALDLVFEFTLFTPSLVLLSGQQQDTPQQRYSTPEEKPNDKEMEAQWNGNTHIMNFILNVL
jgi:hypothetical protein